MSNASENLLDALRVLRHAIIEEAARRIEAWQPFIELTAFAPSAINLAHYLAFRHHDLRDLQRELMRHGLSSLGRAESRVLLTLENVEMALAAMLSKKTVPHDWPPASSVFFHGEIRLQENACALMGESSASNGGRVLVTLSTEAAEDPAYLLDLARRGADLVRINCAHDDREIWAAMIANTRAAAQSVGRAIPVLMDLAGPKFRIGAVKRQPGDRLRAGDHFKLLRDASCFSEDQTIEAVCDPANVLAQISVGSQVVFDDGKLSGNIVTILPDGVVVEVLHAKLDGFKMRSERGFTFPRTELRLEPLTSNDLIDLDFVAVNADMVGFSFVQTADDITRLQTELAKRRPDWQRIGIVAKIETLQAVKNLPDIIVRAAGKQPFGVMIARGDLAVAIGFERMAEMQEEILWVCEAAHVPVIWATQVLEEMVKSGLPTRGEMTDAAMSGRAECVMLNKGPNVGTAITVLKGLLPRMEEHRSKKTARLRALTTW
jgi:pyruvate kinase